MREEERAAKEDEESLKALQPSRHAIIRESIRRRAEEREIEKQRQEREARRGGDVW